MARYIFYTPNVTFNQVRKLIFIILTLFVFLMLGAVVLGTRVGDSASYKHRNKWKHEMNCHNL